METPNDYTRRLEAALAEIDAAGIKRANAPPPVFRLARRLGLSPRPPHYMSFARAALLTGPAFGLIWGLLMWVLTWRDQDLPMLIALLSSILAGALFGLMLAGYYRWSASEAGLSRWEDL